VGKMFTGMSKKLDIHGQLDAIKQRLVHLRSIGGRGEIGSQPNIFNHDILVIQTALNLLGFMDMKDVDGCFGEATVKALRAGKFSSYSSSTFDITSGRMINGLTINEKTVQATQEAVANANVFGNK
jgi:hypothetical protein